MRILINSLGLVLALMAPSAYAVPTLFFDGDINYTAETGPTVGIQSATTSATLPGELSVTSVLTATTDIFPAPELIGSNLSFTSFFDSLIPTSNPDFTAGMFTGGTGLTVTGGDTTELLTGDFNYLFMIGLDGSTSGTVRGEITATGGTLADLFGVGNLIALEFNLTTVFSDTMFDTSFAGNIDGRLEGEERAVPEPGVLPMLGLGLVLLVGVMRRRLVR